MSIASHRYIAARERGVGLIEVLITLLVLAIGFSASAGLQLTSIRANQSTLYRSQAATIIESMMDRMRNNPIGVANGYYDGVTTDTIYAPGACANIECTPLQLASEDVAQWRHSIAPLDDSLPKLPQSSQGFPPWGQVLDPVDGVYTIELSWEAVVDGELSKQLLSMSFIP